MTRVTVASSPDDDDHDQTEVFGYVGYSAEYFFLYPDFLSLEVETGEIVDPQTTSFFIAEHLDALARFVDTTRSKAAAQPESWPQRVGETNPTRTAVEMTASRTRLVTLLDGLAAAVATARERGIGVLVAE